MVNMSSEKEMDRGVTKNRTFSIKRYFAFSVAVWILLNVFFVYWDISNQLGTDPQHLFRMLLGVGVICLLGLIALGWAGMRILGHVSETERLSSLVAAEKTNALLSKIRFESIFNSITDGIVFTDRDRKIIMINQGFVDLLGYSHQEVKGKDTSFLYVNPAEYDAIGEAHYLNDNNVANPPVEIEAKKKDGFAFMAELQGTEVLGLDGKKLGYVWIVRDITERYVTMMELALNRKRLEVMLRLNAMSDKSESEVIQFGLHHKGWRAKISLGKSRNLGRLHTYQGTGSAQ
jgi:PAS domain S-box-containing protein